MQSARLLPARSLFRLGLLATVALTACRDSQTVQARAAALHINGSTTVNLPVAEAADRLRETEGMQIRVDTQGGSSGGISMLGEGAVDIGMSSKPLTAGDRAKYPGVDFIEHAIGQDAVSLVVSKDVWEGGVRSLSRSDMQGIYEGRIGNWSDLGGPDQRIAFFNKEPGRGTWEVFANWLYGTVDAAPAVNHAEVGGNEEARNKVANTRGALSPLSSSWADQQTIFALALRSEEGEAISATRENIASGRYAMSRPLFLLTNGTPEGSVATFVGFLRSPAGQKLVRKHGYLSLDQVGEAE